VHKIDLHTIKQKMDRYELSTEKDRCAYWIEAIKSCRLCLFNTLCNLERNTWKDTHEADKTI
jgi:hypothetical protein